MTTAEAKEILSIYRPGIDSPDDPDVRAAVELMGRDGELQQWFAEQQRFHSQVRCVLASAEVGPDLKSRILAQRRVTRFPTRRVFLWTAAAASVAVIGGLLWRQQHSGEGLTFANFQSRMVGFALREYRMDVATNDATKVRNYLRTRGVPADFALPEKLASLGVKGGASLQWQTKPVAMMCFDWQQSDTLYLFVIGSTQVDAPADANPTVEIVKGVTTVRWKSGDTLYLLVGKATADAMRGLIS